MSRVALIGENSIEYVSALVDIWNHGNCAVLLDWRMPFQTLWKMMKEANVETCFIEKSLFDKINNVNVETVEFFCFETKRRGAESLPDHIYDKFHENYSKDEAVIIYSSGTTGNAKGIILSHFAINTNADAIIDYMRPNSNDCMYITKPLSHSSSITGELLVALKTRMKLVVAPTVVPPRFVFNNINKFGVSIICLNPTLLSMYADGYEKTDLMLPSLKKIYVSGAILNEKVYEKAHKVFQNIKIYNIYGLSEAGPRVSAQRDNYCNRTSVGKALNGVEIAIVDEVGIPVPEGETGIIHVNTPSLFLGYVNGDKQLASKYRNWLNTGDVGYFDNCGELHIVGRSDDVIGIGAHKIYPSQIENLIMELGNVKECVVTTIEVDGANILCCLYASNNQLRLDIKNILGKFLMKHEIPKVFIKTDVIPKTPNGKISAKLASDIISKQIRGMKCNDQ